jgi:hypothetical protein
LRLFFTDVPPDPFNAFTAVSAPTHYHKLSAGEAIPSS